MIKSTKIMAILSFIIVFSSCVKDGETECPVVRLHFFAEKFQNKSQNPLDDREERFCDRIKHVRYFLYKDGQLTEEKIVDTFDNTSSNCFTLEYSDLPAGNYEAVVVGNSTKTAFSGDPVQPANLLITHPGCMENEDYFTAVFPFTVNSGESKEYEVGLLRAQGVVRYTFVNMPVNISDFEVFMTNVGLEKWVTADYKKSMEVTRRFSMVPATRQGVDEQYVIGSFPTVKDQRSAFSLNLYRDGEQAPYFSRMITDTVNVVRNQLVDIVTTFGDGGNVNFEVILDNTWNGSLPGAIVEMEK